MKRWEEQQRKKLYNNRIQQAKPTLVTQPSRKNRQSTASLQGQTATHIRGGTGYAEEYQVTDMSSPSMGMSGEHYYQTPPGIVSESMVSSSTKRQDQPIFHLLKAFKLQQYAAKLTEVGYGQDIYKLALLNDPQRHELINQLKVLPGHKAKLMSLFDVIDEIYPRKVVAEQLKQFATPGSFQYGSAGKAMKQSKRVQSAYGSRPQRQQQQNTYQRTSTAGVNPRSLIHQYDALDQQTKQAFNNTFLINLESVKYSIPQLFQQYFKPEDGKNAINYIFPPSHYYSSTGEQAWQSNTGQMQFPGGVDPGYNQDEVDQLVTKYVGRATTLGQGTTGAQGSLQHRQGSSSQGRSVEDKHLKQEMAHTMKVIERINKEFEHLTKASQKEYDNIKQQREQKPVFARQSTGGSKQTANTSQSYIKRKSAATNSSIQSSKPQSVQSSKRQSGVNGANSTGTITRVLAHPPLPAKDQNKPISQQQYDLGRMQSNRALARQKQLMQPRVITEHEVASETTTPQHSQMGRGDRSKSKERSLQKPAPNISVLKINESALSSEQQDEIQVSDQKPEELHQIMEVEAIHDEEQEDSKLQVDQIESCHQQSDSDITEESDTSEIDQPQIEDKLPNEEYKNVNIIPESPLKRQIKEPPKRKLSPLLERDERELLWNNALGHSLDSKQVASALGYLDVKQICLCLAQALNRHIQFSQGFYFLDDLQEQIKALQLQDQIKLDFSYDLDPQLKIDLEGAKRKRNKDQDESAKKEFEELKQKMAKEQPPQKIFEYKQATVNNEDTFDRGSDDEDIDYGAEEEEEEEQYIQDYYGNNSGKAGETLEKEKQLLVLQALQELKNTNEDEEDEPIDLDYSFSHLEDFLRSQRGTGSIINTANPPSGINHVTSSVQGKNATTQQLMNTFLTSYNKNKAGGASARSQMTQEVIIEAEKKAEQSGGSHEVLKGKDKHLTATADSLRIDVRTKEGFKDLIRFQMRIFDYNYDFETDSVVDGVLTDEFPTIEELYYYCKYVILSGRMEKEIPILCLVYIERFLTKTGILLNHLNWRRITLISLTLASKIWDDDSLENVHFPKVMPDVTLKEIASLEKIFLQFLEFDLLLRGAEYAKYYFIIKTFSQDSMINSCLPPVGPLTAQKMIDLQNNTAKVESELRQKYDIRLSLQNTM